MQALTTLIVDFHISLTESRLCYNRRQKSGVEAIVETEKYNDIPLANTDSFGSKLPTLESTAEKMASDLIALSRVSAAVSSRMELENFLQICLDNVLHIMDGTAGGIMILDEQTKTLSYSVCHNLSAKYAEEMRLKLGEGIAGRVAQTGKAVLLEDISVAPEAARRDLICMEGLKAFFSIPLQSKGNILGVMNVTSHMPRQFTKTDKHFLHTIGDLLGVGIGTARLYDQLSISRESYRQLARQTLVAQEEGRKWLARELHDETSQSLSGMAMQLQALVDTAEMSDSHNAEFIARLKKVHDLTVQVHTEISRLIANLHPPLLDTLGLVPAIRQHAESSLRHLGINVSVEAKGRIKPLLPEAEIELYRVAQGAIANIAQHSKAKNATVYLEYQDDELLLQISDDGQGFDVSQIMHIEEGGRGRGVFSMRERIKILGGTMIAESQPGQGSIIRARVPII